MEGRRRDAQLVLVGASALELEKEGHRARHDHGEEYLV